ncbi:MAG TPA: two-component regulator propeller domain-containing protein, partial [Flavobacteriales bacterium]|nr:two-component regulator propeller domain-containing protein [Flavobacteriales bacterium]
GLPSNTVYCALEDREGYLWFGTDAGASRFDGSHFQNFTTSDGLLDNEVLGMFQDSQDRLWFLSLNGRLCYWKDGRFHGGSEHPELDQLRPTSGLTAIAEDQQGRLWFSGITGDLYSWSGGQVQEHEALDRCSSPNTRGFVLLVSVPQGDPWLLVNGAVHRIRNGVPVFQCCWKTLPQGNPVVSRWEDELIGNGARGLASIDSTGETVILPAALMPSRENPRSLSVGHKGDIWIPIANGGITWIEDPGTANRRSRVILRRINVNTSYEDSEGNRWLSTDGHGVVRIDPAQQGIGLVRVGEDHRERSVSAVLTTRSGELLFGTTQGSIHLYRNGSTHPVRVSQVSETVRDRVRDLQETTDGIIQATTDNWCGSIVPPFTAPTVRSHHFYDVRVPPSQRQADRGMKSLATDQHGRTIGSFYGLADLVDTLGGPTFVFRTTYWAAAQRIYAPFVDAEGAIWFETNEQLHCWRNGEHIDFPELAPHFGSRITDIDALPDGTLVVATAGRGVQLIKDGKIIRTLDVGSGLPSDQCRAAIVRGEDILVATATGAAVVTDPLGAFSIRSWTMENGLPSGDVQDIDKLGNDLYLATPEGLCITPIDAEEQRSLPPRLRIMRLATRDSVLVPNDTVRIAHGSALEVGLHAFTFAHPEAVRYAFRHEGDTAWTAMSGVFTLDGLAPGTHIYQMRARKSDSAWSTPISLQVIVIPPWYRTNWAMAGFCALVLLAAMGWVRYALRRAVRQQRTQLERQRALTEERQRIAADMHDDLGADISHLLMLARHSEASATLSAEDRRNMATIGSHAGAMMKKIDEVIWSLDPDDDRLFASLEFLQRFTESFATEHGLGFRTRPIEGIVDQHLAGSQRRALYLLLKELLQNVVKHTDVRNIRFEVRPDADALLLLIEDDGTPHERGIAGRNGHGRN